LGARIRIPDLGEIGVAQLAAGIDQAMISDDALSAAQFVSLQEVGRTFLHDSIPSEDAALLLDRGLIYRLLGNLRITAAGRTRLTLGR